MTNPGTAGGRLLASYDGADGELLAKLFAPVERWGWEYRVPTSRLRAVSPAPAFAAPLPRSVASVCSLTERFSIRASAVLAILFTVAGIVFGLEAASWDSTAAAQQTQLSQSAQSPPPNLHFAAWTPFLWLAAVLFSLWAVVAAFISRRALRQWMGEVAVARQDHERAWALWSNREAQERRDEEERELKQPQWFAIRFDALKHLDVFGGTAEGWTALLTSIGCSLLGAGGDVNLVDLSQDDVAHILLRAARACGYSINELTLPKDSVVTDVFGTMDAAHVADVLSETAHGADLQPDNTQRSMDTRLLTAVCGALDGPLTVGRVCAGLRLLLGQEPAPGTPGALLGEGEYDRIAVLFADSYLQQAASRVAVLESVLHPLAVLGADGAKPQAALYDPHTRLQVVRITDRATALSAEATTQFVLQVLLGDVRGTSDARRPGGSQRTIIVAGADDLRGSDVERLTQLGRRRGIRIVLLFRHLRGEAEELLGASDTVFFMRLGNAAEAARAAEYIGREHRFVIHQSSLTTTDGTSESVNVGRSASVGRSSNTSRHGSGSGRSSTSTTSSGTTTGESYSLADSAARQRVYEFAVEPTALQSLPDSVFVFVDPTRPRPRARLGNCDPRLLGLEITRDHPAPLGAP
jgi:hypothetical protein